MTDIDEHPAEADVPSLGPEWTTVCPMDQVRLDRGVAAVVGADLVAVFRLTPARPGDPEEWRAVSHVDPATGVPVMARGLVGSVGTGPIVVPTVASPLHKQRYNLRSGYCLDDDALRLETFEVRIVDNTVQCRPAAGRPEPV